MLVGPVLCASALAQNESRPASAPATAAVPKNPEKVKAALNRFREKNSKKRSMSSDMDMTMSMMGMDMKGSGTIQVHSDGRSRVEMAINIPMFPEPIKTLVINDGKNTWQVQEMPQGIPGAQKGPMIIKGTKEEQEEMAKKMGGGMPGSGASNDPNAQVEQLTKEYDLDAIEESVTIDGKNYWAVSGERRKDAKPAVAANPMMGMMKRVRILFTTDNDLFAGMEMLDGSNKKIMTMTMKNFNLDPKFTDAQFSYTPPEGAKVMNFSDLMKGGMQMGGGEDEDEEDEEAKPASKPAGGK